MVCIGTSSVSLDFARSAQKAVYTLKSYQIRSLAHKISILRYSLASVLIPMDVCIFLPIQKVLVVPVFTVRTSHLVRTN